MVEAAGIEPASGNVQLRVSTGLVRIWISFPGQPPDRQPENQPRYFLALKASGQSLKSQPDGCRRFHFAYQASAKGNVACLSSQCVFVVLGN